LWTDGKQTRPEIIPIQKDGTFMAVGKLWGK
jgi:hypothetical protein